MELTPQQEDTLEVALNAASPNDFESVAAAVSMLVEFGGGVNDLMRVHFLELHTDPAVTRKVEQLLDSVPGMPGDGPLE